MTTTPGERMKQYILCALLALLVACSDPASEVEVSQDPLLVARNIDTQLDSLLVQATLKGNTASIATDIDNLRSLSIVLLSNAQTTHSQCGDYLAPVVSAVTSLASMAAVDIERQYLNEAALPEFDDPLCYHIKELVVHPAFIEAQLTSLAGKEYNALTMQIREMQEHLALLYPSLRKK